MAVHEYSHPPVIEVALGMEYVPGTFDIQQVLGLREELLDVYPGVQLLPALPPHPPLGLAGSFVGLTLGSQPNRWWFISEDGSRLVQLQHDRLVLNWRKTTETSEYPRHHTLLPEFLRVVRLADAALDGLTPTSLETDYFNRQGGLTPGTGLGDLLVGVGTPPESPLEASRIRMEIVETGRHLGRHVEWTLTAQREADDPAVFNITTRSDAGGLAVADPDALGAAFESLHGVALEGFERHTKQPIRERWG